jgi:FlaA1/EpsC-like NDP-sugar epimerase
VPPYPLVSRRLIQRAKRISPVFQLLLDSGAWAIAVPIAVWTRLDFLVEEVPTVRWFHFAAIAVGLQALIGLLCGLYRRCWRYATFEEAGAAARSALITTGILYATNRWLLVPRYVPASVPILAGFGVLVAMGIYRYLYRLRDSLRRRPGAGGQPVHRTLVFGAGEAGTQLLNTTLRDRQSPLVPVALLDDDPNKRRLSIRGVKVVGTRDDIEEAAGQFRADTLVIAIRGAAAHLVAEITDLGRACGLSVKVLPSISELMRGAQVGEIRDVTEEDLLGRQPVTTDVESVAGYLKGKRVLVTGAGGSIGAELCRQIHAFGPARLLMLDRDESSLHSVQLSLDGRGLLESPDLLLADLRDHDRILELFATHRPEVVFHAAALKHLTLLERNPAEAIKSNIWGTLSALEAAAAADVPLFVNISTDKAADPISVLGYSKRIAERLTAYFGLALPSARYLSVRFGNVIGSRGSVLTAFHQQITNNGPVTVTDPDVTRFFMTVAEAVQLVIQAGAIGRGAEVLILDMGQPVRIADVARRLIAESGRAIEIVYTGLRPGEKLHEALFASGEADERPGHPKISHASVPPLDPDEAMKLRAHDTDVNRQIAMLARLASLPVSALSARITVTGHRRAAHGNRAPLYSIDLTESSANVGDPEPRL